jgi:hypothetical protein
LPACPSSSHPTALTSLSFCLFIIISSTQKWGE